MSQAQQVAMVIAVLGVCCFWTTIECLTPRPIKIEGLKINSLAPTFFLTVMLLILVLKG